MPQISEKLFRITLTNEFNGDFIILPNDMIGWEDLKIVLERDYDTFGFNQFFEGSFTFINEGRKFISDLYNQYFVEAKIELKIEVLMPNFASGNYITIGVGRLNLSDLSKSRHLENRYLAEEEADQFLELSCKIDMSGFAQNIQNNNEKLFDVDFTESIEGQSLLTYPADKFGFELPLHSKAFFLEGKINGSGEYNVTADLRDTDTLYSYNLQLDTIIVDEFVEAISTTPTILSDYIFASDSTNSSNPNFDVDDEPNKEQEIFEIFTSNTNQNYQINIKGEISINVNALSTDLTDKYFYICLWDSDSLVVRFADFVTVVNGVATKEIDYTINLPLTFAAKLKVWGRVFREPSESTLIDISHNLEITISSQTFEQSTTSKSYLIYELLDKCLSFNTSKNDVLRSSFFGRLDSFPRSYVEELSPSNLAITNGALIRKFADYQNVTITLKQFLEDLQSIFCIGWSVENESGNIADPQNLRVEFIDYFFQLGLIFKFSNPDDLNFQIPTQFLQNRYEFGYKKFENDFESTLDDTHTKRNYNNHLTAVKNGVSYLSELIASSYAIENARRQSFDVKPKESFKYDEDNFVIQCARGQFKVSIIGVDNQKIIIRKGSVISSQETFDNLGIINLTIFNAGSNNGTYNLLGYVQTGEPNSFDFKQELGLVAFLGNPLDLQADSYALISTTQDKFFPEQDQNFTTQNLIDPASSYNLRITPNRNLMRWFRFWKTSFYKYPFKFFKFAKGIQNYKLITNLTGSNNSQFEDPNREVSESENFVASDDKQAILPPSKITFNHPLNIENFAFILRDANRYKEYNVTTDGKSFYQGFLDRISYNPYEQLAEISLIAELKENSDIEPPSEPPTSIVTFPCNSIVKSGGRGITTIRVELDPNGGVLAFGLDTLQIPDKVEGIHNGIKVFTSGMAGIANSGPFDDGTIQNSTPPQYIGSLKGVIPNRIAEFELDTGLTQDQIGYRNSGYKQLVWFKYTAADFVISPFLDLVVTGFNATEWTIKRFCQIPSPPPQLQIRLANGNIASTPVSQMSVVLPSNFSIQVSVSDELEVQYYSDVNGLWYTDVIEVIAVSNTNQSLTGSPNFTLNQNGVPVFGRYRNITTASSFVEFGITQGINVPYPS